jgi:hypothetical protein
MHRPGKEVARLNRQELHQAVDPKWQAELLRFIDSGEASDEFLAFMDKDPACQRAVEAAFDQQALAFEELSRSVRASGADLLGATARTPESSTVSQEMAHVIEQALELPPEERSEALRDAASTLTRSVPPRKRKELEAFMADLQRQVAVA